MIELENIIELNTNDSQKRLALKTKYLAEVDFTFDLIVRNDSFEGGHHFCVSKDQLGTFVTKLGQQEPARLDDNDSDGFIEITPADKLGHLTINAQAGGSYENHVKISFNTDQTACPTFIADLEKLLT